MRQALLADEARIAYVAPTEPSERIVELEVLSSLTGDKSVTITFNSGLNAFIGGRGSGKSAILEYLRFGLARTERDLGSPDTREREEQLIEETLADGGYVAVTLVREGVRETWHRDLHDEKVTVLHAAGEESYITLADARRRFRGRAFFQKQLSSTTRDTATATDQITGIAAAESLDRRRELDQAIDNAKREVTTTIQSVAALWQTILERGQAAARVKDLKQRIENINDMLKEVGVSPEALAIIADAPRHARCNNFLGTVNSRINAEHQRIGAFVSTVLNVPMEQFSDVDGFPELAALKNELGRARGAIAGHMDRAIQELSILTRVYGEALEQFDARYQTFLQDHAVAVAQQQSHKALLDENARLVEELRAAEAAESKLATQQVEMQGASIMLDEARTKLATLLIERRTVLADAADKVASKSSSLLTARLKRDPIPTEYVAALLALTEGAHVPDAEARIAAWVTRTLSADPENAWRTVCDALLNIYKTKILAGNPPEPTESSVASIREFFRVDGNVTDRQIGRLYHNLGDTNIGALLAAAPNDFIVMTYVDEGKDIAFAKASPGQQASALLELLLRQSAGTLIIDQPEDDLDNRVIMRIVQLVRTSKNSRQLIFATHNPNIVVNGDADKVIALKAGEPVVGNAPENPRIELFLDGAIETPPVREAITHIMEGGKDAFDLRSRKYRFDRH